MGHEQTLLVCRAASPLGSGEAQPAHPQLSTATWAIWEAVGHLLAGSLALECSAAHWEGFPASPPLSRKVQLLWK